MVKIGQEVSIPSIVDEPWAATHPDPVGSNGSVHLDPFSEGAPITLVRSSSSVLNRLAQHRWIGLAAGSQMMAACMTTSPAVKGARLESSYASVERPFPMGGYQFNFDGDRRVTVTHRTFFDFSQVVGFNDDDKAAFIERNRRGLDAWNNVAEMIVRDATGEEVRRVAVDFQLEVVTDRDDAILETVAFPGESVTGTPRKARAMVSDRVRMTVLPTPDQIVTHEMGHVFGQRDEYSPPSFLERLASPILFAGEHADDNASVMNGGTEFRPRHFQGLAEKLQEVLRGQGEDVSIEVAMRPSGPIAFVVE